MNEQFTEYLNCQDIAYFISLTMIDKKRFPDPILQLPPPVNLSYWKEPEVMRESFLFLPKAAGSHLHKQWVYSLDCGNLFWESLL